ncbi:hypothetical protein CDAR_507681 [Caerostris darwini]|uniref:Uncharacterized protein n=1 Tax=Caerostris darwini TaxID=1538125 RepID=A0AAV4U966_9ARAC|nr:hypothetical protein CDAR_507681 [Caerostris darwini]
MSPLVSNISISLDIGTKRDCKKSPERVDEVHRHVAESEEHDDGDDPLGCFSAAPDLSLDAGRRGGGRGDGGGQADGTVAAALHHGWKKTNLHIIYENNL